MMTTALWTPSPTLSLKPLRFRLLPLSTLMPRTEVFALRVLLVALPPVTLKMVVALASVLRLPVT